MKLVPLEEISDDLWAEAHATMYDLRLSRHMGSDPSQIVKPPLLEFYNNIMTQFEAGHFKGWAILDSDGKYLGHTVLVDTTGEWEVGTVLRDEALWSSGIGVRATLHALHWAFDTDQAEWVIAFTHGRDPRVHQMVARGGFRPFMNFWVLSRDVWEQRWRRRMKN